MLRTLGVDRFALVTSDIHMRRALPTFRKQGLHPVPAIADHFLDPGTPLELLVPTSDGLLFTEEVLHEYLGLVSYFARGWL